MESFAANAPRNLLGTLLLFSEVLLVILGSNLSYQLQGSVSAEWEQSFFYIFTLTALAWLSMGLLIGNYGSPTLSDSRLVIKATFLTFALQAPLVWTLVWVQSVQMNYTLPVAYLLESSLFTLLFVVAFRYSMSQLYARRKAFYRDYRAVIVGSGRSALAVEDFLRSRSLEVHHFATELPSPDSPTAVQELKRTIPNLKNFCLEHKVKEIYYALPINDLQVIEEMIDFAENNYIAFKIANDFSLLNNKKVAVSFYDQTPVISMKFVPLASRFNRLVKRLFDIAFSLGVMLTIFPIMYLIVGFLIKIDSPGPVFFRQTRAGRKNKKFKVYKFRTMHNRPEEKTYKQASKDDSRITKIGAFLRKTSLDEFPQFINVLRGDMSIVGPRPHPVKLDEMVAPVISRYHVRYWIKPGITGWAQVNGYRGETKETELMRKRVEHDDWYIENWSLALDVKIIVKTVTNIIQGEENAY